ncbi:hypothetical protein NQ318_003844 [Aromia moschata]|uniref:Uncharacterized protein n=1 Tax=Aromia moschata TaxID=1265417 RepID=A0AAV8Z9Z8_9CUCU|nr:hypothetical protein NQ318_003844 [Aromia moschata]
MAIADNVSHTPSIHTNSPFDTDPKKIIREDGKDPHLHRSLHDAKSGSESDPHKHRSARPHDATSSSQQQREREYKERKERERLAAQQKALLTRPVEGAPRPPPSPMDPKMKSHSRPSSVGGYQPSSRAEPRDILREASRDSRSAWPAKTSGTPFEIK